MWTDVAELARFYAQPMGRTACRLVCARLGAASAPPRERVLGLGFAVPYLDLFRGRAERVLAFMPASQGVLRWPAEGPAAAALVEDTALPLTDAAVDRVVLVHCLETAESGRALLREVWRVLAPKGRLVLVAPNRRGLWARTERTPFGQGRPYSRGQLDGLLREVLFEPMGWSEALLAPPLLLSWTLGWAPAWERSGAMLWPAFAGVILVEAEKRLYAPIPAEARLKQPVLAPSVRAPGVRPF
jgi:SAM-dependent methyltransferase